MQRKQWLVTSIVVVATISIILSVASVSAQGPQPQSPGAVVPGSPFTYQGQLKNNGSQVNGPCDIAFRVFNAPSGGAESGNPLTQTLAITNGLFTTQLDFGPIGSVFNGNPRWLDMQVRCPAGGGGFTPLNPRQALTAAPYALSLAPGAVIQASASDIGVILLQVIDTAITGSGTALFAQSNTGYAGYFLGRVSVAGDMTIPYNSLSFGAQTRQMLNLWIQEYGIGVQSFTEYFRSAGGFAWFKGGTHSDPTNNPGLGGATLMTLSASGVLSTTGDISQAPAANGTVKAAAYASCGNSGSSVLRSFNTVNGATVTISNGSTAGTCKIDFGFPITGARYVVVTPYTGGSPVVRGATLYDTSSSTASFFTWDATLAGSNGFIDVLVY